MLYLGKRRFPIFLGGEDYLLERRRVRGRGLLGFRGGRRGGGGRG